MARCIHCHKKSILISSPLEICVDCIRTHFDDVKPHIDKVHARVRERFNLPPKPPKANGGLKCNICMNLCQVAEDERGYCGVRVNKNGKFTGGRMNEGNFTWYYDSLPTNCVAEWVCPAGTECGFPEFSFTRGIEYGYKNLAVFFKSCTFNCLFCQNWHYREESTKKGELRAEEIADGVDERTACICYFGGDPTPQLLYAVKATKLAMEKRKGEILRICWETNGSMNPKVLEKIAQFSLKTGGCIKFDLKAWHEEVHTALCGVSNRRTLSNFKLLANHIAERPEPPFLTASTLLVPGYVDEEEVSNIARFIASLDPNIPYSLLGFYPQFYMRDLPTTSRNHAERCLEVAKNAGLRRVKIGNVHLLGNAY